MKKMNNKGFSLVELIVVIAIMAVLVGVLAPQFIKYVENSRRATDVSTAENIRESILADIADQRAPFDNDGAKQEIVSGTNLPSAIADTPAPKATGASDHFSAAWDAGDGTCDVYVTVDSQEYLLTDPKGAASYKNQLKSGDTGFDAGTATVGATGNNNNNNNNNNDNENNEETPGTEENEG